MVHQMMSYIKSHPDDRQVGFIGDAMEDLYLGLYTDANWAGDRADAKSTSGIFLCLLGPHTFFPLSSASRKQVPVSFSTPEAEAVAANEGLRKAGLPMLDIWERILGRVPELRVFEDNQAAERMIRIGKFDTLKHTQRTHKINLAWVHDVYKCGLCSLEGVQTQRMAADAFTKFYTSRSQWAEACALIGVWPKAKIEHLLTLQGPTTDAEPEIGGHTLRPIDGEAS